jgi:large subunit ribosomal protein L25
MEEIRLTATRRKVKKGAAKRLREEGFVPGILYGHDVGNVPLKFDAITLGQIVTQTGATQLIQLQLDEADATQPVLLREIQRDVLTGSPIHVDVLAVSMTETITAELTLNLIGEPQPVIMGEGILLQGLNTLEIECLPGDLIPSFDIEVDHLEIGDGIFVEDLELPANITILADPDEMVAQVVHVEEEEEEEEEELFVEEGVEAEVIGRERDEDEEEFAAEEEEEEM